jgi:ferrochelatase
MEAILYVSFGGPDGPEDVMPFLENVTRGRNVPRERLLEVAEHYHHHGGRSPINDQNRAVISALRELLAQEGPGLHVYWGNRNWHPFLADTLREMKADGVTRAHAFVTSAFSSYSGCRQYRENLAQAKIDAGFPELEVRKLRVYFDHPGFVEPMIDNVRAALDDLPGARLIFTAHSIPLSMAETSRYESQLRQASEAVARGCGTSDFDLVWQSRSGPPTQPWLEPDILDHLRALSKDGLAAKGVVVVPIGFVSDHMEVLHDLDTEAADLAAELGIGFRRAATVGADPRFVRMIRDLVLDPLNAADFGYCTETCCPAPQRPPGRPAPAASR